MPFLPRMEFAKDHLSVAYRGSLEKQALDIRLKIQSKAPGPTGVGVMMSLIRAINQGLAGGAEFHPAKGSAKHVSGPLKSDEPSARGPNFAWKLDVAGVSPLFVRTVIESLRVYGFPQPVVSMSIAGALPLDDTALSIRERDVLPWLASWCEDVGHYPKAWPTPSLPIKRIGSPRGASIRLKLAGGAVTKAITDKLVKHLGDWTASVLWYPNASMSGPGKMDFIPKIAQSKAELTARYDVFDYVPGPTGDMLVNLIEHFHTKVAALGEATIAMPEG